MKLKIEIDLGNAAFGEGDFDCGFEVARILKQLSLYMVECGCPATLEKPLHDINGNNVGKAEVSS